MPYRMECLLLFLLHALFWRSFPVNISADALFMSLLRSWAATIIASQACNCSNAVLHEIKACMICRG